MDMSLLTLSAASAVCAWYWHWLHHRVRMRENQGDADGHYMRMMAYTNEPISPPYCWRPFVPVLARVFGYPLLTTGATLATPLALYGYMGGGWKGCAVGLAYIGNVELFQNNIKSRDRAEGVGHLIFTLTLWTMAAGHPAAYPLAMCCVLTRESLGAAVAVVALLQMPTLLIPIAFGGAAAYFLRRESTKNRHPLVEGTASETFKRWAAHKRESVYHWTNIVQPLRGACFAIPFTWGSAGEFERSALAAFGALFFFGIPATGCSRVVGYGFALCAPFVAALPAPWMWSFVLLAWFWPFWYRVTSETGEGTGGEKWGYVR